MTEEQKKKNGGNGKFKKRRLSFAQVSNTVLRNKTISLKAKGLYALIQSYLTLENFDLYKWYLQTMCKEGNDGFNTAWKELKNVGVLKQIRTPSGERGQFEYEYELLDEPDLTIPSLITLSIKRDKDNNTNDSGESGCDTSDDHIGDFPPYGESTTCSNHHMDEAPNGKHPLYNNTESSNTDYNNIYNNLSINQIEDMIKKNIDYNTIFKDSDEKEYVDNMVNIIVEVLYAKQPQKINGNIIPYDLIKHNLMKVVSQHISYVLLCISKLHTPIGNIRAYLLTSLYNSVLTLDTYYSNHVKADFENWE